MGEGEVIGYSQLRLLHQWAGIGCGWHWLRLAVEMGKVGDRPIFQRGSQLGKVADYAVNLRAISPDVSTLLANESKLGLDWAHVQGDS